MTEFTAMLGCGCLVFPAAGTRLDIELRRAFREGISPTEGLCLLHGRQPFVVGVRNGSGFTIGVGA